MHPDQSTVFPVALQGLLGEDPKRLLSLTSNVNVGGLFSTAGSTAASNIAKWDGVSWSALGAGLSSRQCRAIVVDNAGNVYAGGDFVLAGGNFISYVAKWNGSSWSAVGGGLNTACYALAADSDGNIYAGGHFTNAGGNSANYIAKWDGSSWSALGTGLNGFCYGLTVDQNNQVYAVGRFTSAGAAYARQIARWDGSNWHGLSSGINNQSEAYAVAVDHCGNVYVGGNFTYISSSAGLQPSRIARWDGDSWGLMGTGLDGSSSRIQCNAIAVNAEGEAFVGGDFQTAGGVSANFIAKWSGLNCAVWTAASDGDWQNGSNWSSNNVPGASTQVTIPSNATVSISNPAEAFSLKMSNGAGLIVNNDLNVIDDKSIVLADENSSICGSGRVNGELVQNDGELCPGSSPGILTIDGDYTSEGGIINIEINGTNPGVLYDQLEVTGAAKLNYATTRLNITLGYTPVGGDFFDIITANSISGTINPDNVTISGSSINYSLSYPDGNTLRLTPDIPLPVELTHFTATEDNGAAHLSWETATELNNKEFRVEHSRDGATWATLATVKGAGTTTEPQSYAYLHRSPIPGANYYRLKQVDLDGQYEYSNVRSIQIESEEVIRIFPNPTYGKIRITGIDRYPEASLKIMDLSGKVVRREVLSAQWTDISNLSSGVYFLTIITPHQRLNRYVVKK